MASGLGEFSGPSHLQSPSHLHPQAPPLTTATTLLMSHMRIVGTQFTIMASGPKRQANHAVRGSAGC